MFFNYPIGDQIENLKYADGNANFRINQEASVGNLANIFIDSIDSTNDDYYDYYYDDGYNDDGTVLSQSEPTNAIIDLEFFLHSKNYNQNVTQVLSKNLILRFDFYDQIFKPFLESIELTDQLYSNNYIYKESQLTKLEFKDLERQVRCGFENNNVLKWIEEMELRKLRSIDQNGVVGGESEAVCVV